MRVDFNKTGLKTLSLSREEDLEGLAEVEDFVEGCHAVAHVHIAARERESSLLTTYLADTGLMVGPHLVQDMVQMQRRC